MRTLQERLHWAMSQKPGATQAELARACKVAAPSVAGWFSGRTKTLKAKSLRAAAAYLGVDIDWLADGVGQAKPNVAREEALTSYEVDSIEASTHRLRTAVLNLAEAISQASPAARVAIPSLLERLGQHPGDAEAIATILATLTTAKQQDARQ